MSQRGDRVACPRRMRSPSVTMTPQLVCRTGRRLRDVRYDRLRTLPDRKLHENAAVEERPCGPKQTRALDHRRLIGAADLQLNRKLAGRMLDGETFRTARRDGRDLLRR